MENKILKSEDIKSHLMTNLSSFNFLRQQKRNEPDYPTKLKTFLDNVKEELNQIFLNKVCSYHDTGKGTLKIENIKEIELRGVDKFQLYFNKTSVDIYKEIKILGEDDIIEIIGIPSGEVLQLKPEPFRKIMDKKLIYKTSKFQNYFYIDEDYHLIRKFIDPKYEKSNKTKYQVGDIILCQGESGSISVDDKVGKIIEISIRGTSTYYFVAFTQRFNLHLLPGNIWWITEDNIKKLYENTDEVDYLEDHEIDDNYHIRGLFNN